MPGIYGFLDNNHSVKLLKTEGKAKRYLNHLSHYHQNSVFVDNYISGISVPYEIIPIGPHHDKKNGLVINLDGRIDYYIDDNGYKHTPINDDVYKIIANLFIKHGNNIPSYLSGSYNITIYSQSNKELIIFNDIIGNRFLYYYFCEDYFIYGPELKTFLAHPYFKPRPNMYALADICNFQKIWGYKTLLEDVYLLPAASILILSKKHIDVNSYFIPSHTGNKALDTDEELIDEGWKLINQSVDRCLADKVSVALPITAGLDSRLLLAAVKMRGVDYTCYTHADSKSCVEYKIARIVTQRMQVPKHIFILISPDTVGQYLHYAAWLNDCTELASASYHVDIAHQMTSGSDGLMNGIFGGHMSFSDGFYIPEHDRTDLDFDNRYSLFTDIVKARGRSITDPPPPAGIYSDPYSEFLYSTAKSTIIKGLKQFERISDNFSEQIVAYVRDTLLRNMMNRKDINRIFQKDELVFSDPDLFRYFLDIPFRKKHNNKIYYGIFKKYLPHLIDMPTIHTGENARRKNLIDESRSIARKDMNYLKYILSHYIGRASGGIINIRNNMQYKHYNQWYRTSKILRLNIEKILLDDRTLGRKHINPDIVRQRIKKQRRGGEEYGKLLILTQIELFYRLFIEHDEQPQGIEILNRHQ